MTQPSDVEEELRPRSWTAGLPHAELDVLCREALAGRDPADAYLRRVADLAWAGALSAVGVDAADWRLVLRADGGLETAALTAHADRTVDLDLGFLRRAALGCLQGAEEVTLAHSTEFGYGSPPSWLFALDDYVARVVAVGDRDRSGVDSDLFALDDVDHLALLVAVLARGERPPPLASPRWGVGELGTLIVPSRSGDFTAVFDPDWGDWILRLHHHMLLNALAFGLVHEFSHVELGHFNADGDSPPEQEVAADVAALSALGVDFGGDLPSALGVFKLLHDADPAHEHSLSHPYSADRIRLLAIAVRRETADPVLLGRVKELLRSLHSAEQHLTFFDRLGHPVQVPVTVSSDWDAVYLRATLPAGALSDGIDTLVGVDLAFKEPVTGDFVARGRVLCLISPVGLPRGEAGPDGLRFEQRLDVPPCWRFGWPEGLPVVERIIDKDELSRFHEDGPSPVQRVLRSGRRVLWEMEDDELVGWDRLRSGDFRIVPPLWAHVGLWADWLTEYGHEQASLTLRRALLQECPELATFREALGTIRELTEAGEHAAAVEVGNRYIAHKGAIRPGLHLAIGRAAAALGDVLAAYDHAFVEGCTFQMTSETRWPDDATKLMTDILLAHRGTDIVEALLAFHQYELNARTGRARHRRTWLLQAAEVLGTDPLVSQQVLSVGQLRAEIYHKLVLLGDTRFREPALSHFDGITADYPWFPPGWIQAAYFHDDCGDRDHALECFKIGELLAPRNVQVLQARARFYPAPPHGEHAVRAADLLERARQSFGLEQPPEEGDTAWRRWRSRGRRRRSTATK